MPSISWPPTASPARSRGPIMPPTTRCGRPLADPSRAEGWRHGAIINHFVRGYWCVPTHPPTGPGLLEPLRFGLRRLYELRLDVDYDAVPISRASAETGVQIVQRTLAEIDHRT